MYAEKKRGAGVAVRAGGPSTLPLLLFILIFFFLHAALHYPNAWNRLPSHWKSYVLVKTTTFILLKYRTQAL